MADANSDDDDVNAAATAAYAAAFPGAATGMGCPKIGCGGYELTQDLDFLEIASADAWTPVGYPNNPFMADFDGNGHVISNLSISARSAHHVGLFGITGAGSNIQRVGLENVNLVGGYDVGGLAGLNNGSIIASYVTGTVVGTIDDYRWLSDVGGLVGYNGGSITASYASVSASSARRGYVGGLVGQNGGAITASYATGVPSGTYHIGGLVGSESRNASVTNGYWDTTTSGQTESKKGVGKTTAQLQSPTNATGIYAAWNKQWWDFGKSTQYPVLKVDGLSVSAQRGGETTTTQTDTGSTTPAHDDRAALVALFNKTGGANWENIPSDEQWRINDPDSPVSDWHGVTTNDDGRVRGIWLPDKGLTGELPAELADLSALTTLYLSRNRLSGTIPSELGSLSNLRWLDLSHNADRGKWGMECIPDSAANCPWRWAIYTICATWT